MSDDLLIYSLAEFREFQGVRGELQGVKGEVEPLARDLTETRAEYQRLRNGSGVRQVLWLKRLLRRLILRRTP